MRKFIVTLCAISLAGCAFTGSGRSEQLENIQGLSFETASGIELISEYRKKTDLVVKDKDLLKICIVQNSGELYSDVENSKSIISQNQSRYTLPTFGNSYENQVEYTLHIKINESEVTLIASNITRGLPGYGKFRLKSSSDYRPDLAIESIDNQMTSILRCASNQ